MESALSFTYALYEKLCSALKCKGYEPSFFEESKSEDNKVYLRHDIDFSPSVAYDFASYESHLNVRSTYFVMLNTPLYNVFNGQTRAILKEMIAMGHAIGLHYVLEKAPDEEALCDSITYQIDILSDLLQTEIKAYSFHRPAYWEGNGFESRKVHIPNKINAYQAPFFQDGAYISDSNHHWRCGDPLSYVKQFSGHHLQILTHPIWWTDSKAGAIEKIEAFQTEQASIIRDYLTENIKVYNNHRACLS